MLQACTAHEILLCICLTDVNLFVFACSIPHGPYSRTKLIQMSPLQSTLGTGLHTALPLSITAPNRQQPNNVRLVHVALCIILFVWTVSEVWVASTFKTIPTCRTLSAV